MKGIFALALAQRLLVGAAPAPNQYISSGEYASEDGLLEVTLSVDVVPSLNGARNAPGCNGKSTGPTLCVKPGDTLRVTLEKNLETMQTSMDRELYEYVNDADSDFANVNRIVNRLDFIGNLNMPGPDPPNGKSTGPEVDIVVFLRKDKESTVSSQHSRSSIESMLASKPSSNKTTFTVVDWSDRLKLFDTTDFFFTNTSIELLSLGKVVVCD
jgi:hypothetical protein